MDRAFVGVFVRGGEEMEVRGSPGVALVLVVGGSPFQLPLQVFRASELRAVGLPWCLCSRTLPLFRGWRLGSIRAPYCLFDCPSAAEAHRAPCPLCSHMAARPFEPLICAMICLKLRQGTRHARSGPPSRRACSGIAPETAGIPENYLDRRRNRRGGKVSQDFGAVRTQTRAGWFILGRRYCRIWGR